MVPPFEAATQTNAAVVRAMALYSTPVQPTSTNRPQVRSSVATVMPEMGLDDEPISPVMRLDTVTKKKPKSTISTAETRLIWRTGASQMATAMPREPPSTSFIERSCSVRATTTLAWPLPACRLASPPRNAEMMVGIARPRAMKPPVATAPAPMYRM